MKTNADAYSFAGSLLIEPNHAECLINEIQ